MSNLVGYLSAEHGLNGILSTQQGLTGTLTAESGLVGTLSAQPTLFGSLSAPQGMTAFLSSNVHIHLQSKEVIPNAEEQTVVADPGFAGLSAVTVGAIPSDYGHIVYNGSYILVE